MHLLVLAALLPLSGCVSEQGSVLTSRFVESQAVQPRLATYRCGQGNQLTVAISGQVAHVSGTDGLDEELIASPSGQSSRYSNPLNALVLEGREAFFMANRRPPLTCLR